MHLCACTRLGSGILDASYLAAAPEKHSQSSHYGPSSADISGSLLPAGLRASMVPRLFIQRVDIGSLVVRATVQGYIPGKQVV